uniref:Uncharacterized protein n=1 Tax=Trichinella nativa TaxID=6335 RepID=A0A0V1KIT9_9BILA
MGYRTVCIQTECEFYVICLPDNPANEILSTWPWHEEEERSCL